MRGWAVVAVAVLLWGGPAACGNCHTPKGADGLPIAGMNLAGNQVVENNPAFRAIGANLTPDKATGLGKEPKNF
jgi:mono/diheme cytochrome c family protein